MHSATLQCLQCLQRLNCSSTYPKHQVPTRLCCVLLKYWYITNPQYIQYCSRCTIVGCPADAHPSPKLPGQTRALCTKLSGICLHANSVLTISCLDTSVHLFVILSNPAYQDDPTCQLLYLPTLSFRSQYERLPSIGSEKYQLALLCSLGQVLCFALLHFSPCKFTSSHLCSTTDAIRTHPLVCQHNQEPASNKHLIHNLWHSKHSRIFTCILSSKSWSPFCRAFPMHLLAMDIGRPRLLL